MQSLKNEKSLQRLEAAESSLKTRIDELTALYDVSRSITSSVDLGAMLNVITRKVAKIMNSDICAIYLVNEGDLALKTSHGVAKNHHFFKKPLPIRGNMIARVVKSKKAALMHFIKKHHIKDIFCRIAKKASTKSFLAMPLVEKDKAIGVLVCCSRRPCAYNKSDIHELSLFASQAAVAIDNARLFEETKLNFLNTMKLLASVIDAKDTYTETHSERVMRSSIAIANALKLSDRQKAAIRYASLLHDIGKIGIDISILRKPAPLTKAEWAEMRKHPKNGADIIKKAGFLDDLIPAILYHHVKYIGGGYPPTRKVDGKIPIEARILAVADAYEAMVTDRPYRRHMSRSQAIAELKRCSGTQFDPQVVKAFLKYLRR